MGGCCSREDPDEPVERARPAVAGKKGPNTSGRTLGAEGEMPSPTETTALDPAHAARAAAEARERARKERDTNSRLKRFN